jgi:hypothetical protein
LNVASKIAGSAPLMIVDMPRPSKTVAKPAYLQYRQEISSLNAAGNWSYLDLSNLIPKKDFVDSMHRNAAGESLYDETVTRAILRIACGK